MKLLIKKYAFSASCFFKGLWNKSLKFVKKYDSKRNRIIISIVILIIAGTAGYFMAEDSDSRMAVIGRFEDALLSRNPYKVYKYLTVENKDIVLTEDNIKPLVDYINSSESRREDMIRNLRYGSGTSGIISVKESQGKYHLELKAAYMTISTNMKDADIYINGKLYCKSDSDSYSGKFGPFVPGTYDMKAVVDGIFGNIECSKSVNILENGDEADLKFDAVKVSAEGNYTDAEVFINDKDSGKAIYQFKNIGPIPVNDENPSYIYAEKKFPWGETVKSEEAAIGDMSSIRLDINPMTDDLKSSLEEKYKDFYDSFFSALSNSDKSLIKGTAGNLADSLYDTYSNKSFIIKNSYSLDDIKWQKDAIAIKYEDGVYSVYAVADISYSQRKNLSIFTVDEEKKNISFRTDMTYNSDENEWFVTAVNEVDS